VFAFILSNIYLVFNSWLSFYHRPERKWFAWQYLTIQGLWLYSIQFALLFVEHMRHWNNSKKADSKAFLGTAATTQELKAKAKSSHPCHMWKICNHFSQMCLNLEIVITLFFWLFEYKATPPANQPVRDVDWYLPHTIPLTLMTIDFCFNRVYYEMQSLWINLFYMFVYGMINLAYTKITGTSVYPVVTWDSVGADLIACCMLPFFCCLWVAMYYLSKCKFKKLEMD